MNRLFRANGTRNVLNLVGDIASAPVTAEDTAGRRAECKDECHECSESKPVGVPVLRCLTSVTVALTSDAEEDHIDNPSNKCCEQSKTSNQCHQDCPNAVIGGSNQAKDGCDSRKSCSYSMIERANTLVADRVNEPIGCRMRVLVRLCKILLFIC